MAKEPLVTWEAGRLLTLTDGVFAIVMTLMVLDIKIPEGLDHADFMVAFVKMGNTVFLYFLSFLILSKSWIGHHARFNEIARVDRVFLGISLTSLALVALVPVATNLVGDYPGETIAAVAYCGLFFLIGIIDLWGWLYASKDSRLLASPLTPETLVMVLRIRLILPIVALIAGVVSLAMGANALYIFLAIIFVLPLTMKSIRHVGT
ncbi:MAG: TMEM175 family protein [Fimbriimonadaceae bacterium]|nr:TMEM175 family protein [Fimbriimonadaceae bacterium]